MKKKNKPKAFIHDPLWYKDAVIYQLHVKSFFDANNDGIGDFSGLIARLDYIAELGVNTVWLLPFYPSPRRDDGYDIAEYRGVHRDYGSMADARRFIAEAHARGIRVITELVINHTSDQHAWFQRARRAKAGSAARNFYVWSDNDHAYAGTRIIFLDTEKSNWTWDPVAGAYFWHRFYSHQPDLNFDNPRVLEAVLAVMRHWLDLGVDGLRLDAVPYLIEREGTNNENLPETHEVLKRIRAEIDAHYPDRMLLAEANQWPEDTSQYFGQGDECHMAFHFPLMPRMYMALAQEDRFPVTDILRQTPDIPPNCQWAVFLRNHDELTLEMVTDRERDYLWEKYAANRRARLNLGIRRRLAPLMERDRRRVELLNSMLLSMPGTPVIYYGDEIGMGDNIYLGDRDGVRTPMQWSLDRNGGFSRADPAVLVLPPIMDALYGYQAVNVEAQTHDPHSLLNWMRRMLSVRKQQKAFGRGTLKLLSPSNRRILAYLREYDDGSGREVILCVANVSRAAQAVELDLQQFSGCVPVEMIGGSAFPPIGQLSYLLTLPPYGFYWFLIAPRARMPAWHNEPPESLPEFRTLVLRGDVAEVLREPTRSVLEKEVLPDYLAKRRWFAGKDTAIERVRICEATLLPGTERPILITELAVTTARGTDCYQLPFGVLPEEDIVTALPQQLALARVRRGPRVAYLTDAFTLDALARGFVELLRVGARMPAQDGELQFRPTPLLARLPPATGLEIRRLSAEQSNSSLVIGDQMILKLLRRVTPGIHPEAEMGGWLTERGYTHIAPLLGEVARVDASGTPHVLAVLQGFRHNQGDGWAWTLNRLDQLIRETVLPGEGALGVDTPEILAEALGFARILGQRLGELHSLLAAQTPEPAFAPERAGAADCEHWASTIGARLDEALAVISAQREWRDDDARRHAHGVQHHAAALREAVIRLAHAGVGSLRTRIHGDLHLGQLLVAQDDVFFLDFEGEPARPLAERRAKNSPLRDVAGILRSFDYAAATASATSADEPSAVLRRRQVIDRFRDETSRAFLEAYRFAARLAHDWADVEAEARLLDLFLLEKAAYELAYEAANRPSWMPVPLRGLAALAERLAAPGPAHG